jgi:hypothetical protein
LGELIGAGCGAAFAADTAQAVYERLGVLGFGKGGYAFQVAVAAVGKGKIVHAVLPKLKMNRG